MSDQELREFLKETVKEAVREHACHFTSDERRMIHSLSDTVDRKELAKLAGLLKFWESVGAWVARVILAALLALAIWGLTKVGGVK